MDRRTFLELGGAAALGLLATACAKSTQRTVDDAGEGSDAGAPLTEDGSAPALDAGAPEAFVIHESFTVLLNDSTCSHHTHVVSVSPASYAEDTEVHYSGGSHELVFFASELVRLERGERVPFSTIGDGPGHGHCGTAWRTSVGPEEPDRPDVCTIRGTATCL